MNATPARVHTETGRGEAGETDLHAQDGVQEAE